MYCYYENGDYGAPPTVEKIGVYKVVSLDTYIRGRDQLRMLKRLYDKLGQEKSEVDETAEAVAAAIQEQEKLIKEFSDNVPVFDSKQLDTNLEYLLNMKGMKVSELESILNVSAGYISRTISAESKKRISIDIVWMIAELFQVNITDLLNRDLKKPSKDLQKVVSFIKKLNTQTDEEQLHWKNLGVKRTRDNEMFFQEDGQGDPFFDPSPDLSIDFYNPVELYTVKVSAGTIYLLQLEDLDESYGETKYALFSFNEGQCKSAARRVAIGGRPLKLLCFSGDDISGVLDVEIKKLINTIKTHKQDYLISDEARSFMDEYLDDDQGLPFVEVGK